MSGLSAVSVSASDQHHVSARGAQQTRVDRAPARAAPLGDSDRGSAGTGRHRAGTLYHAKSGHPTRAETGKRSTDRLRSRIRRGNIHADIGRGCGCRWCSRRSAPARLGRRRRPRRIFISPATRAHGLGWGPTVSRAGRHGLTAKTTAYHGQYTVKYTRTGSTSESLGSRARRVRPVRPPQKVRSDVTVTVTFTCAAITHSPSAPDYATSTSTTLVNGGSERHHRKQRPGDH